MIVSVVMVFSLLTWLELSAYRIAEFLDSSLESFLRSLGSIIFESYSLIVKRYLEILHSLLKSDILLHLLHAVLAVEMHKESDFLYFAFLLCRLLVGKY